MGRKVSRRRREDRLVILEKSLQADLRRLTAAVADCTWRGGLCPCHEAEWRELESVRLLLGE